MHGTFLNNAELKQHERTPVNDNDIVVFGTKVTRGTETIPACAFRITYAYSPYKYATWAVFRAGLIIKTVPRMKL